MGCCGSKKVHQNNDLLDSFDQVTKAILLDSKINNIDLYEFYNKWSNDFIVRANEVMKYEEFTKALHITPNVLVNRLFKKFGFNKKGNELKFVEFFCFLWSFLTIHDNLSGSFLHFVYDSSNTGKMSLSDMDVFLHDMKIFLDPELFACEVEVSKHRH